MRHRDERQEEWNAGRTADRHGQKTPTDACRGRLSDKPSQGKRCQAQSAFERHRKWQDFGVGRDGRMHHVRSETLRKIVGMTPVMEPNSLVDSEITLDLPRPLVDTSHGSGIRGSSYIFSPAGSFVGVALAAHRVAQGIPTRRPLCATGGTKAQCRHQHQTAATIHQSSLGSKQTHRITRFKGAACFVPRGSQKKTTPKAIGLPARPCGQEAAKCLESLEIRPGQSPAIAIGGASRHDERGAVPRNSFASHPIRWADRRRPRRLSTLRMDIVEC